MAFAATGKVEEADAALKSFAAARKGADTQPTLADL
jgi:hypothetical protein